MVYINIPAAEGQRAADHLRFGVMIMINRGMAPAALEGQRR